jgi:hypothetical protein
MLLGVKWIDLGSMFGRRRQIVSRCDLAVAARQSAPRDPLWVRNGLSAMSRVCPFRPHNGHMSDIAARWKRDIRASR